MSQQVHSVDGSGRASKHVGPWCSDNVYEHLVLLAQVLLQARNNLFWYLQSICYIPALGYINSNVADTGMSSVKFTIFLFVSYLQLTKWTNKTHQYCFNHELHLHEHESCKIFVISWRTIFQMCTLNRRGSWFLYSCIPDRSPMCFLRISWFWRLLQKFDPSTKVNKCWLLWIADTQNDL